MHTRILAYSYSTFRSTRLINLLMLYSVTIGTRLRCTGLVRTVDTNSGVRAFIVGVVVGLDVAGGDSVSVAGDGQVPVSGNIDALMGVDWVIVYGLERGVGGIVRDEGSVVGARGWVVVSHFWGSHVIGT